MSQTHVQVTALDWQRSGNMWALKRAKKIKGSNHVSWFSSAKWKAEGWGSKLSLSWCVRRVDCTQSPPGLKHISHGHQLPCSELCRWKRKVYTMSTTPPSCLQLLEVIGREHCLAATPWPCSYLTVLLFFFNGVSQLLPGWLGTWYVDKAGFELIEVPLPLSLECCG